MTLSWCELAPHRSSGSGGATVNGPAWGATKTVELQAHFAANNRGDEWHTKFKATHRNMRQLPFFVVAHNNPL